VPHIALQASPPDLFPIVAVVAILVFLVRVLSLIQRGPSLKTAATELGLQYDEVGPASWITLSKKSWLQENKERLAGLMARRVPEFPLFGLGYTRRAVALLRGSFEGRSVTVIDFRYTAGGGEAPMTEAWLCAVTPAFATPQALSVMLRGRLSGLAHLLGGREVRTGFAAFDAAYLIACDDDEFARALFDDGMTSFFLDSKIAYRVEAAEGDLMCAAHSSQLLPSMTKQVSDLLETLNGVAARVPSALRPAS